MVVVVVVVVVTCCTAGKCARDEAGEMRSAHSQHTASREATHLQRVRSAAPKFRLYLYQIKKKKGVNFFVPRRVLHPAPEGLKALGAKYISNRGVWHY